MNETWRTRRGEIGEEQREDREAKTKTYRFHIRGAFSLYASLDRPLNVVFGHIVRFGFTDGSGKTDVGGVPFCSTPVASFLLRP